MHVKRTIDGDIETLRLPTPAGDVVAIHDVRGTRFDITYPDGKKSKHYEPLEKVLAAMEDWQPGPVAVECQRCGAVGTSSHGDAPTTAAEVRRVRRIRQVRETEGQVTR